MQHENMIAATECCMQYNIEYTFINELQQFGLIEVTTVEQTGYIPVHELAKLEKLITLYYELDINLEGIEAITHLLGKVEHLQHQMQKLQNKLRLYEG